MKSKNSFLKCLRNKIADIFLLCELLLENFRYNAKNISKLLDRTWKHRYNKNNGIDTGNVTEKRNLTRSLEDAYGKENRTSTLELQ